MPIRQKMRYDRNGNVIPMLPDEIKVQVLQIAHERVLAQSKDSPLSSTAEDVMKEAEALLTFFDWQPGRL